MLTSFRTKFTIVTIAIFMISTVYFIVNVYGTSNDRETTLVYDKDNYSYTKLEPVKGTYLGAYVLQNDYINQDMGTYNEVTGKQHASYFRYVGYGKEFPTAWVEEVKAQGAFPHIAFEPNNGLEAVVDDEYLRNWARAANATGVPIYIRWASEMNGTWTQYSGHEDLYIEKWRMVYNIFKEEAPNCAFVWTVFTFPESTIEGFYPGDDYVDWVGVNIYNVVYHNDKIEDDARDEDPRELLDYVYNTYSYKKPIQISEYAATHYTATDGLTYSNFASEKIATFYNSFETYYPRVKSIFYFDVNNLTHYNEARRVNNYSVVDDELVLKTYKDAISSKQFLSEYKENTLETGTERLTYSGFTTVIKNRINAPIEFFEDYLGLSVNKINGKYYLSNGEKSVEVKVSTFRQKTNFGITRKFNVIPVVVPLRELGYTFEKDDVKDLLYIRD